LRANDCKVEFRQRERLASDDELSAKQGVAALAVALHVITWNGEKLQWLPGMFQA
jgi:hypothetical protein